MKNFTIQTEKKVTNNPTVRDARRLEQTKSIKGIENQILEIVCGYYRIPLHVLKSKHRVEPICEARQVAMSLLYHNTQLSLVRVAQLLGRMDHTTVLNGIEKSRLYYNSTVNKLQERVNIVTATFMKAVDGY